MFLFCFLVPQLLFNVRCCIKEKQILCSCVVSILPTGARKKSSHVKNVRLGDSQTSGGDGRRRGRRVCVYNQQKAPFYVWKSQGPLEARHASVAVTPSHVTPFLKPGAFPDTSCTTTAQRFFLTPLLAWPPPSSPATTR